MVPPGFFLFLDMRFLIYYNNRKAFIGYSEYGKTAARSVRLRRHADLKLPDRQKKEA
jgi:hypothetical protein